MFPTNLTIVTYKLPFPVTSQLAGVRCCPCFIQRTLVMDHLVGSTSSQFWSEKSGESEIVSTCRCSWGSYTSTLTQNGNIISVVMHANIILNGSELLVSNIVSCRTSDEIGCHYSLAALIYRNSFKNAPIVIAVINFNLRTHYLVLYFYIRQINLNDNFGISVTKTQHCPIVYRWVKKDKL